MPQVVGVRFRTSAKVYYFAPGDLVDLRVDDFVIVELQTDQTTSTGKLIDALNDFQSGKDVTGKNYGFGMNTYDTLKRSCIQILNKGVVMDQWEQRI